MSQSLVYRALEDSDAMERLASTGSHIGQFANQIDTKVQEAGQEVSKYAVDTATRYGPDFFSAAADYSGASGDEPAYALGIAFSTYIALTFAAKLGTGEGSNPEEREEVPPPDEDPEAADRHGF